MRRITTMAIFALLVGGLAACGNDDSDDASLSFQTDAEGNVVDDGDSVDDAPDTDPGPSEDSGDDIPPIGEGSGDDDSGNGDGSGGSGAAGTVTVGGVEFGFDEVLRCEEDSSDLDDIERMLEVTYTGGDVRLDLYTSEMDGVGVTQTVNWAGPDGRFNGGTVESAGGWLDPITGPTDGPAYAVDGDRITGSATLAGDFDPDMQVEVSFDVLFPDETIRCR